MGSRYTPHEFFDNQIGLFIFKLLFCYYLFYFGSAFLYSTVAFGLILTITELRLEIRFIKQLLDDSLKSSLFTFFNEVCRWRQEEGWHNLKVFLYIYILGPYYL